MLNKFFLSLLITLFSISLLARGGGGCLLEGTEIDTISGKIEIQRINKDTLISTKNGQFAKPLDIIRLQTNSIISLQTANITLNLTYEHPLLLKNDDFKTAGEIEVGDQLKTSAGNEIVINKLIKKGNFTVYNLILPTSGVFKANSVYTHNKGCFIPETPILMSDYSTKMISQIKTGDEILGFDSNENVVTSKVQKVYRFEAQNFYSIHLDNNEIVNVTDEHPFYIGLGHFKLVKNLKPNDEIYIFTNVGLQKQKIIKINKINQKTSVYNLLTSLPHTYFAGQVAVHNKGGGGGGRSFGGGHSSYGGNYRLGRIHSNICYDENGQRTACRFNLLNFFEIIYILLPFLIPIFILLFQLKNKNKTKQNFLFAFEEYEPRVLTIEKLLQRLSTTNKEFELESLRYIAQNAFLTLQKSWEQRSYQKMASLSTSELKREHEVQINSMLRNNEINKIDDLKINFIKFVYFDSTAGQEKFVTLIEASAKDYYVNANTYSYLRGDVNPNLFQEIWIFKLINGYWLLDEIQQTEETNYLTCSLQPSLKSQIILQNKNWNPEIIQNQARFIALEYIHSLETLNTEKLTQCTSEDFFTQHVLKIQKLISTKSRWEYRNLCIRKVEQIYIEKESRLGSRIAFRIHFHAQRFYFENNTVKNSDVEITTFSCVIWLILDQSKGFILSDIKFN